MTNQTLSDYNEALRRTFNIKPKNIEDLFGGLMKAVHIKTGNTYIIIDDKATVKIDGEWVEAIIYKSTTDTSLPTFIRPKDNFDQKFVIIYEPHISIR